MVARADDRLWWEKGYRTTRGRDYRDSRPFEFCAHAIEQYMERNSAIINPRVLEANILSERTFETDYVGAMKLGYYIEPYFRSLPHTSYIPDPDFDGAWVINDNALNHKRMVVTYYSKSSVKNRRFAEQLRGFLENIRHLPETASELEDLVACATTVEHSDDVATLGDRAELRRRHGEAVRKWVASRVSLERARKEKETEERKRREHRCDSALAQPVPPMPVLPIVDWVQFDRVNLRRSIELQNLRRSGDRKIVGNWASMGEDVWQIGKASIPLPAVEWYAANPQDQSLYWPAAVRGWVKLISEQPNRIWDYLNDDLELPKRAAYDLLGWKPVDLVCPVSGKKAILYLGPDDPLDPEHVKRRVQHDYYWKESVYVPPPKFNHEQQTFLTQAYEVGGETAAASCNRQQFKRWKANKEFKLAIKDAERTRRIRQQYEALYPDCHRYQADPDYVGQQPSTKVAGD